MSTDEAQMSNEAQNPNEEKEVLLAFNLPARTQQAGHLDFNCHLDFDIWIWGERMMRLILYSYY